MKIVFTWLFLLFAQFSLAQSGFNDSLITLKKNYTVSENIFFKVQLDPSAPNTDMRMIETMSCACGNKDFYYTVYSVQDSGRTTVIKHLETEFMERCACKSLYALFENGKTYSIPSINLSGNYQIEIGANDYVMKSTVFTVSAE